MPIVKEKKSRKTNFLVVRPLFGPFCKKSAKIWPQFFLAALLFTFYSAPFELCSRIFGQLAGNTGVLPLYGPFCTKLAKNLPQIYPSAPFIRPLLSYAVEQIIQLATLIASLFAGPFLPPSTAILMDSAGVWQWVDFFWGAESTGWEPTISKKYYLKRNKQLY